MSFSSDVKEELSRLPVEDKHCAVVELSAIIQYCGRAVKNTEGGYEITLHTENGTVARRFYTLIKETFGFQPKITFLKNDYFKKNRVYAITLENPKDTLRILKSAHIINDMGQVREEGNVNVLLSGTNAIRAFLRGAFLSSGSITDPEKNYHFEVVCSSLDQAEQLCDLLTYFKIEAKTVKRKKYDVVYIKEGSMISDVLNVMEAHKAMMDFENVRILKDVRNEVNRRVNCEAANINKTVSAAHRQIEDIEYIESQIGLRRLPVNLQDVARARLERPDASLKELGEMLEPPVGKSGVNHRLRKLGQMARDLRENGHVAL